MDKQKLCDLITQKVKDDPKMASMMPDQDITTMPVEDLQALYDKMCGTGESAKAAQDAPAASADNVDAETQDAPDATATTRADKVASLIEEYDFAQEFLDSLDDSQIDMLYAQLQAEDEADGNTPVNENEVDDLIKLLEDAIAKLENINVDATGASKAAQGDDQRRAMFANMADGDSSQSNRIVNLEGYKKALKEVRFQRKAMQDGKYSSSAESTPKEKRTISKNYKRAVKRLREVVDSFRADGRAGAQGALSAAGVKSSNLNDHPVEEITESKAQSFDVNQDTLYAVKYIGDPKDGVIKGYRVLWGDPTRPDASPQKDFFRRDTDFMGARFPLPHPLFFHHGLDAKTNSDPWIGTVIEQGVDDWGMWYKAQLRKAETYDDYAKKLMANVNGLIAQKALKDSSDGIPQYTIRVKQANGTNFVKRWALAAQSLTPVPAEPRMRAVSEIQAAYKSMGVDLQLPEPEADAGASAASASATATESSNAQNLPAQKSLEDFQMTEQEIANIVAAQIKAAREAEQVEAKAKADAEATFNQAVEAKAKLIVDAEMKKTNADGRKLKFAGEDRVSVSSKYDDLKPDELAMLAVVRIEGKAINRSQGPDEELLRALAAKSFTAIEKGQLEAKTMEDAAFKANEVMQSTLAGYGDEWVTTNFSNQLWLKLRGTSRLLQALPQQEIPKGYESDTIPLESATDFTFYNVSQAATMDATMKTVPATITPSQMGTANRVITIGKIGARGLIAGELDEDSIVDAIPEANRKLNAQMPEELDFVLFNGDPTAAVDNINGNGTPVSGADYTALTGIIRLGLKTNTANAKDMGAAIDSTKINALYQLLGADGLYVAEDPTKCLTFCDYQTWWKIMSMSDLLTVANAGEQGATIMRGALPDGGIPIFGVKWYPSVGVKKAQATGIRHGTEGNNTLGRAVLLRPDQWKLRWKRRAKFETTRVAYADLTELVVTLRLGLGYFDTDSAAVGYNI